MKQGFRFFFRPSAFVNQLQWSSHHGFILTAFLTSAFVETQVGRNRGLYAQLASALASSSGFSLDFAIFIVVFAKLGLMLGGALILAEVVQWLGGIFGSKHQPRASRRVLYRRMAVVLSVLLLAHAAGFYANVFPLADALSLGLWVWGLVLGYFALREQFSLSPVEAFAIGGFAMFLAVGAWNFAILSAHKSLRHPSAPAIARKAPRAHYPKSHFRPFFR